MCTRIPSRRRCDAKPLAYDQPTGDHHGCGNCQLLLRRFQRLIIRDEPDLRKRALLLPQLIGLAMGLSGEELGLREGAWR